MNRRSFVSFPLAALLWSPALRAQPSSRRWRVAIIPSASLTMDPRHQERTAGWFAQEGFVEGRDLSLEYTRLWSVASDPAEVERRQRAVVASRPDVILVPGSPFVAQFRQLAGGIPIVFFAYGLDPVRAGWVESYRRPGGNVTGTTLFDESVMIKVWEALRALRPQAKRLGDLWDEDGMALDAPFMTEIRALRSLAASRLGFDKVDVVVPTKAGFTSVERAITAARVEVLQVATGSVSWVPDLMRFLERSRIPAMWESVQRVREGGLISVGPSIEEACRDAIRIVAQILRGANPATTPVRLPTRYETAINLRTARAMDLSVPSSLLLQADQVFDE